MGLFDTSSGSCSLIKNEDALDFEWVPKIVPYRESQQRHIAFVIKPLLDQRNGRNLFICGVPGVGKTVATKHVLRELEEQTDKVAQFYINCWQKNTTFKIFVELCHQMGYMFTQNKKTEELFGIFEKHANQSPALFIFDEIDKVEDFDFLYTILERVYKKSIILITNYKDWLSDLDERIASRLLPEREEFLAYSKDETRNILKQRICYAFANEAVFELDSMNAIVSKTFEREDIRVGLYLLRESAFAAEEAKSRRIAPEHVEGVIGKLEELRIKKPDSLDEDARLILDVVKASSPNSKIGDLFRLYQERCGESCYKTFQRKIDFLNKNRFISTLKTSGGLEGNTTLVSYTKKP